MLSERDNWDEVVHRGNPDHFANQYDALGFVRPGHPILAHRGQAKKGEIMKKNDWGCTVSWPEDQPGAFPVHTEELLVMPDVEEWKETVKAPKTDYDPEEWEKWAADREKIDTTQQFITAMEVPGVFEICHYLGEIQNICMAFYESPDELHELIEYITEWELRIAEGICKYMKPEVMFHHDDWGTDVSTFVSPEMFADFFEDPYTRIYGYYHDHGAKYVVHHSDSYAATLVPTMINMGIDVWQGTMSINNIPELIEKYGDKITFMGGLDSTIVDVPDWSREIIRAQVEKMCDACGPLSFIPCQTQGLNIATFPGVYDTIREEINRYSEIYFANKQ